MKVWRSKQVAEALERHQFERRGWHVAERISEASTPFQLSIWMRTLPGGWLTKVDQLRIAGRTLVLDNEWHFVFDEAVQRSSEGRPGGYSRFYEGVWAKTDQPEWLPWAEPAREAVLRPIRDSGPLAAWLEAPGTPLGDSTLEILSAPYRTAWRAVTDEIPRTRSADELTLEPRLFGASQAAISLPPADPGSRWARVTDGVLNALARVDQQSSLDPLAARELSSSLSNGDWLFRRRTSTGRVFDQLLERPVLSFLTATQQKLLDRQQFVVVVGRAGSSKTTLALHSYLRWCVRWSMTDPTPQGVAPPRLLVRGQPLRDDLVSRIRNHAYAEYVGAAHGLEAHVIDWINGVVTLTDHLRDGLSGSVDAPVFPDDQYVGYSEFAQWYADAIERSGAANWPSHQTAWFCIRSIVKGYEASSSDEADGFTMERFDELPRRDTEYLDRGEVERIVELVWPSYRGWLREESLWDDQDLALAVQNSGRQTARPVALAIDEAQDLTRLELLALVTQLPFFDFDLTELGYRQLPFVLAGDEQQTVHPTAFRWGNITSALHELTGAAFGTDRALSIDQEPLSVNFRSSQSVVDLSNLLLFVRRQIFRRDGVEPQRAVDTADSAPSPCFDVREVAFDSLVELAQRNVLIAPTSVDVAHDLLGGAADEGDVRTASETKGLEYASVVLVGWGTHARQCGFDAMDGLSPSLELRQFLSELYVAVTRARHHVVLLEDGPGLQWWGDLEAWVNVEVDDEWRDRLRPPGFLDPQLVEDFIRPVSERAEEEEKNAMSTRNSAMMKRAAELYSRADDRHGSVRCAAWAAAFDGNLDGALEMLWADQQYRDHLKLAWEHRRWDAVAETAVDEIRGRAARSVIKPDRVPWPASSEALREAAELPGGDLLIEALLARFVQDLLTGQRWPVHLIDSLDEPNSDRLAAAVAHHREAAQLCSVVSAPSVEDVIRLLPALIDALGARSAGVIFECFLDRHIARNGWDAGELAVEMVAAACPELDPYSDDLVFVSGARRASPRAAKALASRVERLRSELHHIRSLMEGDSCPT